MLRVLFRSNKVIAAAVGILLMAGGIYAQNFSGDARAIGMGGVGNEQKNVALSLAGEPETRSYISIPIPLGLFQVVRNTKIFDPGDEEFNPVRAMEYAANPIHFTAARDGDDAGEQLVTDLVNGRISRDLTAYRGFVPYPRIEAKGLIDPSFGKTFRFPTFGLGPLHAVYVGAGPYISLGTDLTFDERLTDVINGTQTAEANSAYSITDVTEGQAAAALSAGYRVRIPVPGLSFTGSQRDGVYLAATYNHLYGFHYDTFDLRVRLETDADGLVTLAPASAPIVIARETSSEGRGYSVDVAGGVIAGPWLIGIAANGVANRMDWEDLRAETFTLTSVLDELEFIETDRPAPAGPRRVELPVRYSGMGGYDGDRWSARVEAAHGLQDWEFRGGAEYRFGPVDLRGGGRYSRDLFHPTGGLGLNLTRRFAIDAATYTTATNIERERKAAFALSLRFSTGDSE